jgi:hypothetical protein
MIGKFFVISFQGTRVFADLLNHRPSKRMRVSAQSTSHSAKKPDPTLESANNSEESDGESGDTSDSSDDKEDMLAALEAYNRSMLGLGGPSINHRKSDVKGKGRATEASDNEYSDLQERGANGSDVDLDGIMSESGSEEDDDDEEGELYDEDEEFEGITASEPVAEEAVQTVVYADTADSTRAKVSKADYKRFMVSSRERDDRPWH